MLELFAQYLDIPAFAVSSKVLYSDVGPAPNTDFLWVDTSGSLNHILKVYNFGTYQEYPFAGTAGAPNTLIDGKGTLPVTNVGSSDNFLVSQGGVLYKVPFSTITASIPATSITYPMLSNSVTEADNVAKRTVKAWAKVNAVGGTIYSDFNVSSITVSTNLLTVNFSTPMADANYSCVATLGPVGGFGRGINTLTQTTSSIQIGFWAIPFGNDARTDPACIACFGN